MSVPAADDPAFAYQSRLDDRRERLQHFEALDNRVSVARGLTFIATIVAAALWYFDRAVPFELVGVAIAAFVILVIVHGPVLDRLNRARLSVLHYQRALARLNHRWAGAGVTGQRYIDPAHPYADDLDLFGRGSLFELLCQARTRLGEDKLADWLRGPASAPVIRLRQEAVEELRRTLDLRESFATLDAAVHDGLDQNGLVRWVICPSRPIPRSVRVAAIALAFLALVTLAITTFGDGRIAPLLLVLMIEGGLLAFYGRQIRELVRSAEEAASGLAILAQVIAVIEPQEWRTPLLRDIRRRLVSQAMSPSRHIARLARLVAYLNNSLQNKFLAPLAFAFCLPIYLVHAIEKWRREVGPHVGDWLGAVGEFEALLSLAGFAYEHPAAPFPELAEAAIRFDARQLGHPLIPETGCVRNDVRLDDETRLAVISGSNMSGKSTMLRTVGSNVVLALAGAPVVGERLTLSVLQLGTAMRIRDSLQSGQSLFYAVISRLKSIVERSRNGQPLLFLFDEILQGTNSHDRLIGSEGVLRTLLERAAIGLITTHDLAITEIADRIGSKAVNLHFEDSLVDGKMTFDYHIRPGVVRKSNALELMRLMGLDVY